MTDTADNIVEPSLYDKIDSRLNIEVVSVLLAEQEMLAACFTRLARFAHNAKLARIVCEERVPAEAPAYKHPGWCEYLLYIEFTTGGSLTIGCLQRTIGAEIEFHS